MRLALCAGLFLFSLCPMFAQRQELEQCILFYNCENLFDPSDNPDKADDDFTPRGPMHWTGFRQYAKMLNLSKAIMGADGMRAPALVGLAEVENDSVMQRLTKGTPLWKYEYEYLITDGPDARGINVALMYQPIDFRLLGWSQIEIPLPQGNRPTRPLLHAWGGIWGGDTLDVVVCHLPSRRGGAKRSDQNRHIARRKIISLYDSLYHCRKSLHFIVMGDMNDYPNSRSLQEDLSSSVPAIVNLMEPLQRELKNGRRPYGSHKYDGEWGFLDQFWVNGEIVRTEADSIPGVWVNDVDVVCFPFMLVEDETHLGHRPFRSYYGQKYEGGFSDHLPVRMKLHIRL